MNWLIQSFETQRVRTLVLLSWKTVPWRWILRVVRFRKPIPSQWMADRLREQLSPFHKPSGFPASKEQATYFLAGICYGLEDLKIRKFLLRRSLPYGI